MQRVIREEFRTCAVLTIAHRVHTIVDYDKVLVMDKGRIVEAGNPGALASRESLFGNLLREGS